MNITLTNGISIILLITTLTSLIVGTWNTYRQAIIGRIIAELQLNIRREMNGRYVGVETFADAKERIARLEREHDATISH